MNINTLSLEDLDLESESKFELQRDAMIEKVVMVTVCYFSIANELMNVKNSENNKGNSIFTNNSCLGNNLSKNR